MGSMRRMTDDVAESIAKWALDCNYETIFDRAAKMKPCPIGQKGACCRICHIGPCRLVGNGTGEAVGVCGAGTDVVVARNFLRMVAGGAAAHSDHARDLVLTLRAVARGETKDFEIRDKELRRPDRPGGAH